MKGLRRWILLSWGVLWLGGSPIFAYAQVTLQARSVEGGESQSLDFGVARSLKPEGNALQSDTVIRRVKLTISGASGRYRVFQRINEPWMSIGGKTLPLDSVRFAVSETDRRGEIQAPHPVALEFGEREIYLSDVSGTATELFVTYTVQIPVGQPADRYRTSVSYRVVAQ